MHLLAPACITRQNFSTPHTRKLCSDPVCCWGHQSCSVVCHPLTWIGPAPFWQESSTSFQIKVRSIDAVVSYSGRSCPSHCSYSSRSHRWNRDDCNGVARFHAFGYQFEDCAAKRATRELDPEAPWIMTPKLQFSNGSSIAVEISLSRVGWFSWSSDGHDIPQVSQGSLQSEGPLPSHLNDPTRSPQAQRIRELADTSLVSQWATEVASAALQVWSELHWPRGKWILAVGLFDRLEHWRANARAPHRTKLRDLTSLKEAGWIFLVMKKHMDQMANFLAQRRQRLHHQEGSREKSNGKCSKRHNQFLQEHFSSALYMLYL